MTYQIFNIMSEYSEVYFECPYCKSQKGRASEIRNIGGVNDSGGYILLCKKCNEKFFLTLKNPHPTESCPLDNNFTISEIIDFETDSEEEIMSKYKIAKKLTISELQDNPMLKNSWGVKKYAPQINEEDRIFLCQKCNNNVEAEIYNYIKEHQEEINGAYKTYFNVYALFYHLNNLKVPYFTAIKF